MSKQEIGYASVDRFTYKAPLLLTMDHGLYAMNHGLNLRITRKQKIFCDKKNTYISIPPTKSSVLKDSHNMRKNLTNAEVESPAFRIFYKM